jgi:hypothetical protein
MNGIIAINWNAAEPHWTAAASPFERKYSLILVYDHAALVAFSVYCKLDVGGCRAIYRSGTELLPDHQARGSYGFFTSEVLKRSGAAERGEASVLYGWRTRNPIVWAANAKICNKVAPSLLSEAVKALELPAVIMRGVYGHIKHHRQAYRGTASLVDAAMLRLIPDSADALFSVGYAKCDDRIGKASHTRQRNPVPRQVICRLGDGCDRLRDRVPAASIPAIRQPQLHGRFPYRRERRRDAGLELFLGLHPGGSDLCDRCAAANRCCGHPVTRCGIRTAGCRRYGRRLQAARLGRRSRSAGGAPA